MSISKLPPSALPSQEPSAPYYGLIEEEFAGDDFQLLVVCIFLNKTKGERAIAAARRLLIQYPKPEILAKASYDDVKIYFQNIGLLRRAGWLIQLSKEWLISPPQAGTIRTKIWGGSIQAESEVAHLRGVGLYASDAWRIFCKDIMYKKAGMRVMESEWKTVKPKDKELRSYLRWRWNKEGYDWDPETGVAIERSLETGDCALGMTRLKIEDTEEGRQVEQVRISHSKIQEVCRLEEVPVSFGRVLKGTVKVDPLATISGIAPDELMKRLAGLGL